MSKTTQFNFSFSLSRTVTIFYHSVMSCSQQSKVHRQTDRQTESWQYRAATDLPEAHDFRK